MGPDAVHLEPDIHAAKDEADGLGEDAWLPYLTITYAIEKVGSEFKKTGQLLPTGVVTVLPRIAWDTSNVLPDSSLFGKVLNTLVGYNDQPTMLQLVVYLATLASILTLMRLLGTAPRKQALA